MSKEIKFTEEEMKSLREIQQAYVGVQNTFGQISVSRLRIEQDLESLDKAEDDLKNKYGENQGKERDFVDGINKKYGDGQLNLETGTFSPIEKSTDITDTEKANKTL